MPARFQKLHSFFGKPFAVVVFGLGKRSANVEHMNSSNAFKIVRILDKCIPCKIVGKVDYIFQSVTNLQLIARQHSEELIALRLAHTVHTFTEIIQRVQTYLAILKR